MRSARLRLPQTLRRRSPARTKSINMPSRLWAPRTSPTCCRSGRAPSSGSATATAPAFTTRLIISTTKRSRSGPHIGCGSRKRRSPVNAWSRRLLRRFNPIFGRKLRRFGDRLGARQQLDGPGLKSTPVGERVKPRSLNEGERYRRKERQALHHKNNREDVDFADLFEIGGDQRQGADE